MQLTTEPGSFSAMPFKLNESIPLSHLKVWVLAPHLETNDPNLDYYYDFTQSIAEYTKNFEEIGVNGIWQPVTMQSYATVIEQIVTERNAGINFPIVFNICDGDEVNGTPGVSVVNLLEAKGLIYTGADAYFYNITTSKITMKEAFDLAGVPTAKWEAITNPNQDITGIFERLGAPLIVKPAVSGGSMGVCIKNVVDNEAELKAQITKMFDGYRGWHLSSGGVVVEEFINGPEFTAMIVGSSDQQKNMQVYEPVERIFHEALPDNEKFLSFDRLWEIYEDETPMPDNGNFYQYAAAPASLIRKIKKISWDAYVSNGGKGYTRVDLRMDKFSGKISVLEVNAQCGLSEDENYTSIGAILRYSNKSFTQMVIEIINDATYRWMKKNRKRKVPALVKAY